jgi:hypothetical protein
MRQSVTLGNNVGNIWEEGGGALECSRVHPISGSLALLEIFFSLAHFGFGRTDIWVILVILKIYITIPLSFQHKLNNFSFCRTFEKLFYYLC